MKTLSLHKFFTALLLGLSLNIFAQQRLVLNGGYIKIGNGSYLVVDNSATNAITRNTGHIISEGESNILKWNLGTATGNYTIPWGYSTTHYIPITFSKSAGTGNGAFSFSTYHTNWNNSSQLPAGVANVAEYGYDMSAFVLDRFWGMDATGYTAKPTLSNMTLTYLNGEVTAGSNTLSEGELTAQRWNPDIQDWVDFSTGVSVDTVNNKLTVPTVTGSNLYRWWVIVSSAHTLPVELTSFKGSCDNGVRRITWTTASEMNTDKFILERSSDARNWSTIGTTKAAGNSNRPINYSYNDENAISSDNYYRLKMLDKDTRQKYSNVIQISCTSKPTPTTSVEVYPNPCNGVFKINHTIDGASVMIYNLRGEIVGSKLLDAGENNLDMQRLQDGQYIVSIHNGTDISTTKLIIQK